MSNPLRALTGLGQSVWYEALRRGRPVVAEARRLWRQLGRDNVLVEIPGTPEAFARPLAAIEARRSELAGRTSALRH